MVWSYADKSHAPMKKSESIQAVGTKKGKGRSKITLVEVVKKKAISIKKITEYDLG